MSHVRTISLQNNVKSTPDQNCSHDNIHYTKMLYKLLLKKFACHPQVIQPDMPINVLQITLTPKSNLEFE